MEAFSRPAESPAEERPDAALLQRARQGDATALDQLLRRYQASLMRYSLRMCGGDEEDAKDVLQESLMSAARHLGGFRGDAKLSTWLFTIARRFCLRKRSRHAPRGVQSVALAESELEHPGPAPEQALATRELLNALEEALRNLDPLNREILVLRDVEGLKAREVAEVVGMGEAQIKSRLHRARVAIRSAIGTSLSDAPALQGADALAESCPDIEQAFSRFLEGEVGPEMCTELQHHVDKCARCRGACEGIKQVLAVCRALPAPEVPEALQESIRSAMKAELAKAER
ncbi:MAG: sigma-70 family RNA polymerase sigma factor [Myxococcales bacterium]|nr:sigma-70 family RNA polymerase sigma factor [Myxococcales bacterium]MDD9965586.1 sigma-70 family RNA polymerase sigma factor [Myxococcales bacterium]